MADPREDEDTRVHWDGLTDRLITHINTHVTDAPAREALLAVVGLHICWERREQQVGTDSHLDDIVLGVGCRMCDYMPSPGRVALAYRHCSTMAALADTLGVETATEAEWETLDKTLVDFDPESRRSLMTHVPASQKSLALYDGRAPLQAACGVLVTNVSIGDAPRLDAHRYGPLCEGCFDSRGAPR